MLSNKNTAIRTTKTNFFLVNHIIPRHGKKKTLEKRFLVKRIDFIIRIV